MKIYVLMVLIGMIAALAHVSDARKFLQFAAQWTGSRA
jgi:hypothetical protein